MPPGDGGHGRSAPPSADVTVISADSQPGLVDEVVAYLRRLWRQRDLAFTIAGVELRGAVIDSPLSYLWWLLEPLMNLLCYVLLVTVLGRTQQPGEPPYPVFIFTCLLPWFWTVSSISKGARIALSYSGPITQIRFPNLTLVIGRFLNEAVLYLFGNVVLLAAILIAGLRPSICWLAFPIVVAVHGLAILAAMTLVAALAVLVTDTDKILPFILRLWFYASPALYSLDEVMRRVSPPIAKLMLLNPMATIFDAHRRVLLLGQWPDWGALGIWAGLAGLGLVVSTAFFIRVEKHFPKLL